MFLLEEIDDWLSKLEPPNDREPESIIKTGVGIYHFLEKNDDE
jgi:hypothetical protein